MPEIDPGEQAARDQDRMALREIVDALVHSAAHAYMDDQKSGTDAGARAWSDEWMPELQALPQRELLGVLGEALGRLAIEHAERHRLAASLTEIFGGDDET